MGFSNNFFAISSFFLVETTSKTQKTGAHKARLFERQTDYLMLP